MRAATFVCCASILLLCAVSRADAASDYATLRRSVSAKIAAASNSSVLAVAAMHGLDSTAEAMVSVCRQLELDFPSQIYCKPIALVGAHDRWDSFFIPMNTQAELFHRAVMADPVLRNGGFVIIGHSQGGVLSLGYITRYSHRLPKPPVAFISLAGVVAGVSGVPIVNYYCKLSSNNRSICDILENIMDSFAAGKWSPLCQMVSFCDYWYDPMNVASYLQYNTYLADILNQRSYNATYANNMKSLKGLHLVLAQEDRIVIPPITEQFGHFKPGSNTETLTMEQTNGYKSDAIGLKTLNEAGKIKKYEVPCGHQDIGDITRCPQTWSNVIRPVFAALLNQ